MTVGIGVIGTGRMGAIHIENITHHLPGARVVALGGTDRERLAKAAQECGAATLCTDPLALIHDPAVHAVLIATPPATHAEFTTASIAAGKPTFVEKPLGASGAAGGSVIRAEQAAGRRLVRLGFMRRYDRGYNELRNTVASGVLGAPLLMHCAHRLPAVPATFGSDMLVSEGLVHEIDVARWLTGEEIRVVRLYTAGPSRHAAPGVADPQFVVLETEGGLLVDVEISVNAGYAYEVRCEVVCEDGTAELVSPSSVTIRHSGQKSSPLTREWTERFAGAFRSELGAWVDDITDEAVTGPDAWDGYIADLVAAASLRSLHEGTEVVVELPPRPQLYSGETTSEPGRDGASPPVEARTTSSG